MQLKYFGKASEGGAKTGSRDQVSGPDIRQKAGQAQRTQADVKQPRSTRGHGRCGGIWGHSGPRRSSSIYKADTTEDVQRVTEGV